MERAIDRLLQFIEYLKSTGNEVKNAKSFEVKCGLSNSYIANAKKKGGNGSIGSDTIPYAPQRRMTKVILFFIDNE